MLKTLIYLVIALVAFFFIIANISLMHSKGHNVNAPDLNLDRTQTHTSSPEDSHKDTEELSRFTRQSSSHQQGVKDLQRHIVKQFKFKPKSSEQSGNQEIQENSVPKGETAPVLENFEDYAPFDLSEHNGLINKDTNPASKITD